MEKRRKKIRGRGWLVFMPGGGKVGQKAIVCFVFSNRYLRKSFFFAGWGGLFGVVAMFFHNIYRGVEIDRAFATYSKNVDTDRKLHIFPILPHGPGPIIYLTFSTEPPSKNGETRAVDPTGP